MNNLLVKLLHIVTGLDAKITIVEVHNVFVLNQRVAGAVGLDQSRHQFHVKTVVKLIDIQRGTANSGNLLIVFVGLKHLDIGVHGGHIFVMQQCAASQRPIALLVGIQKIARIETKKIGIPGTLLKGRGARRAKVIKELLNFIYVHRHIWQAFPMISAAIGDNARAHARINLVQNDA